MLRSNNRRTPKASFRQGIHLRVNSSLLNIRSFTHSERSIGGNVEKNCVIRKRSLPQVWSMFRKGLHMRILSKTQSHLSIRCGQHISMQHLWKCLAHQLLRPNDPLPEVRAKKQATVDGRSERDFIKYSHSFIPQRPALIAIK